MEYYTHHELVLGFQPHGNIFPHYVENIYGTIQEETKYTPPPAFIHLFEICINPYILTA